MVQGLLSFEIALKGALALLALLFPHLFPRALGWAPAGSDAYWPRIAGSLFAGIAAATALPLWGYTREGSGLGLAGHVAINVILAFVLLSLVIVGPTLSNRRGRVFALLLAIGFAILALLEIAHL